MERPLQARIFLACGQAGDVSCEVTSAAHQLGGGAAAYRGSVLLRALCDVQTSRQHFLFAHRHAGELGKALFGAALWSALAASAAAERRPGRRTLALASATGLMNGLLLFAHLCRGLHRPDVFVGPSCAAAGLVGAGTGMAVAPGRRRLGRHWHVR